MLYLTHLIATSQAITINQNQITDLIQIYDQEPHRYIGLAQIRISIYFMQILADFRKICQFGDVITSLQSLYCGG